MKERDKLNSIYLTCVWLIWKIRKNIDFLQLEFNADKIMEEY